MNKLDETTTVDCVFSEAIGYVEKFFEENAELELQGLGLVTTRVDVSSSLARDGSDSTRHHDALSLAWDPAPGLPLPSFSGHIQARPHFAQTELRLKGEYKPPLGPVGEAFDAIAGYAIAAGTARALLSQVKRFVESRRKADRARYPSEAELNATKDKPT
ncbi:MAG: hypothetical protein ACLQPV_04775 [Vulcanimicrobiaceae bacterium]